MTAYIHAHINLYEEKMLTTIVNKKKKKERNLSKEKREAEDAIHILN